MKKIALTIFAIIFLAMPLLSFGQEESSTNENTKTEKKVAYAMINEYGPFVGGTFGFTGVFINGISIKKSVIIAIGVGYEVDTRSNQSLPIFLNFRHYFGQKTFKPLINFAVGTRISFGNSYLYDSNGNSYEKQKNVISPGLYATMASGFRAKAFSFTAGFFLKSYDNEYFGGVEVKVGFTF